MFVPNIETDVCKSQTQDESKSFLFSLIRSPSLSHDYFIRTSGSTMQNKKKTTQRNVRFIFLCDTCDMHLPYFDFRIYASIQMRLCANQKSRIRQFPSPIFFFFIQHNPSMGATMHGSNSILIPFFIEMADVCKHDRQICRKKKPYNALSPKKKHRFQFGRLAVYRR